MKLNLFNTDSIRNSRLPWIDYARGIAIFLVLYRHIYSGIRSAGLDTSHYRLLEEGNIVFFSFRMPLFFMVSGVFLGLSLGKRGLGQFIENKWKMLLYPYFLWALIQVTLQLGLSHYVNAGRTWRDYLYILYRPREIDQFWYLYALFNTTVLYVIARVKLKMRGLVQVATGLVLFFVSGWLVRHRIYTGFAYDIMHYYIFIAVGDTLSAWILDKKNIPLFSSWKLFFIILPVFVVCQWYFLVTNLAHSDQTGVKTGYYSFVEDYLPVLFLVIAMSGVVFMMNVSFLLQRYKAVPALRVIGYNSLYIYLMHVLASSVCRIVLNKVFGITNVPVLFVCGVTVGLIVPVVFYNIAMQLGWWWLFSLEPPKQPKEAPREKAPVTGVNLEPGVNSQMKHL